MKAGVALWLERPLPECAAGRLTRRMRTAIGWLGWIQTDCSDPFDWPDFGTWYWVEIPEGSAGRRRWSNGGSGALAT